MGFLPPVAVLSRCIHSPADPQAGSSCRVLLCVWHQTWSQRNEGRIVWRCHGLLAVAAMFLADSDGDGMCEWANLSSLFFPLLRSLSLSQTPHSPHHPPRLDRITASSVLFN